MNKENQNTILVANPQTKLHLAVRVALWLASCIVLWIVMGFVGIVGLYLPVADEIPELPELSQYNPPLTTRVFSQSGILLGEFAIERRDVIPAKRIPPEIVEAFIASEDDNFFNHGGIDPMGILRAAIKNIRAGRIVQGGSTITQQVAKSFIGREKTFTRKFKEAVLARRLEEKFDKEDILYLYLNQIYLGHGSYGVQAAARNYFRRNVWELDLGQMATLAGLPQAPSDYDPVDRPEAADQRRKYVLERMQDVGFADEQQVEQARNTPIDAQPIIDIFRKRAPYFTEEVRRQLQQKYGTEGVYEAGLSVETTVDLDWQRDAQVVVNQGLKELDHRQGYRGPLINLKKKEEIEKFLAAVQEHLPDGAVPAGQPVLALVEKVTRKRAELSIGLKRAVLPVMGMRWARKPDPTVHFKSAVAKVTNVRKVLKKGDVILVQKVRRAALMVDEPPEMKKVFPEDEQTLVVKLDQIPGVQGALISVEPRLGYVKAIIGGYNFSDSEFNRALQACRQPGSAFKPIHYSLAIEDKGFNPATIIIDSAVVYDDPENQNRWKPENYDSDFKGKVTVHTALVKSMNVPSIKVLDAVGIKEAIAWAQKLGITTPMREELGLALGASCVKPWELTKVYSVFNLGGLKPAFRFIEKVTDRFGRVLTNKKSFRDPWQSWDEKFDRAYDHLVTPPERLISAEATSILVNLLHGVATRGTGARSNALGKPVAGKTGTTNDSADAWFMGFTHDVVTSVWVGNDEPKDPLGRGETGSRAALPIWVAFMQKALGDRPQAEFDVPEGVTFVRIDPLTGLRARPDAPNSVMELFRMDERPTEFAPAVDMATPDQLFKVDQLY